MTADLLRHLPYELEDLREAALHQLQRGALDGERPQRVWLEILLALQPQPAAGTGYPEFAALLGVADFLEDPTEPLGITDWEALE